MPKPVTRTRSEAMPVTISTLLRVSAGAANA